MEVLFVNTVPRVAEKGEIKRVAPGYARNFLFPRNYAVPATEGAKRNLELVRKSWEKQAEAVHKQYETLAEKLNGLNITIAKKAGEKGKLFGSVTNAELAEAINKATGAILDKKLIAADHIKEVGIHEISLRLPGDVKADFNLVVVAEED
ncbi:MAG: 50S ribosomal protein L9 [Candidatus Riflebacteria bacterium]|nr:50S ribosomal protein L9 [Candidatus Riflebacteria bacterium]